MATILTLPTRTTNSELENSLRELAENHDRLSKASIPELIGLAEACIEGTANVAHDWVDTAGHAKGISPQATARAEDLLTGPVATIRHLRLIIGALRDIETFGRPSLPGRPSTGRDGRLRVSVFPAKGLFDSITFQGFRVESWLEDGVTAESLRQCPEGTPGRWTTNTSRIAVVLGAGNVSSIPTTDAFTKLFQEGRSVLLKMNPVNQSLGTIFEQAYAPLIRAGYLRIIYGGADVGAAAVNHERVDEVHITGSIESHDAIVWGPAGDERQRRKIASDPVLHKPITSELGNVTPWIVVPGHYTEKQLDFQAENIATSITNNCSFNCIATKVIVTCASWPDRERFLGKIRRVLQRVPPRKAYYPGAVQRFARFTGHTPPAGSDSLPWTLLAGVTPETSRLFFREESFVCVSVETPLAADSGTSFLDRAVDFVNSELWGTLGASITLPPHFRKDAARENSLQAALRRLDYGTIAINHWTGLAFAMMSPPWGGVAGSTLADAQSGIGWVHNTAMLDQVEKSVMAGPLTVAPQPMWFATHSNPERVGWRLLELYRRPSLLNLGRLLAAAARPGRI